MASCACSPPSPARARYRHPRASATPSDWSGASAGGSGAPATRPARNSCGTATPNSSPWPSPSNCGTNTDDPTRTTSSAGRSGARAGLVHRIDTTAAATSIPAPYRGSISPFPVSDDRPATVKAPDPATPYRQAELAPGLRPRLAPPTPLPRAPQVVVVFVPARSDHRDASRICPRQISTVGAALRPAESTRPERRTTNDALPKSVDAAPAFAASARPTPPCRSPEPNPRRSSLASNPNPCAIENDASIFPRAEHWPAQVAGVVAAYSLDLRTNDMRTIAPAKIATRPQHLRNRPELENAEI